MRALRRYVEALIRSSEFSEHHAEWTKLPARQVINPLFALLCSPDPLVKWRSVTAVGIVVAALAERDMESARVIVRRMLWNLNDESGGIGWGLPEAMGEILALHRPLAEEYAHMLLSLIREDGNYLEHAELQRGVLWGLGRLAHEQPHLLRDSEPYLVPFLTSEDAELRGMAVWVLGALKSEKAKPLLQRLRDDTAEFTLYVDEQLDRTTISSFARRQLISA